MEVELGELTDEEAAVILDVLERDKELKKREESRVSQLAQTGCDPLRLRGLTGTWFTEERDRRHQRGGVDIVHASIRQKRRVKDVPLTTVFESRTDNESKQTTDEEKDDSDEEEEEEEEEEHDTGSEAPVRPTPQPRTRTPLLKCEENESNSENKGSGEEEKAEERNADVSPSGSGEEEKAEERNADPPPSSLQETDSIGILELDPIRIGSTSSLQYNTKWNGSVTSLRSVGEVGDVAVSGQIQFSLQYHHHREELVVCVYRCQNLAQARKNRTNPYVKVYLLPDTSTQSKRKTSVKKKTVNPIYNEIFTYKVADVRSHVLSLSVWHTEALRANVFLGAVEAQLNQWDWDRTQPCWQSLQPRFLMDPAMGTTTGTLLMSMKFIPPGSEGSGLPPTGELHIWLKEAVVVSSKHRVPSIFVKSCVLPDESQSSGQRTRVVRRSASAVFNHTMVYDGIHSADLTHICLEMTVWDKHTLNTHCLGGVRFSTGTGVSYDQTVLWMDSSDEEQKVWMAVMNNHNRWVESALPLRTDLQPYT